MVKKTIKKQYKKAKVSQNSVVAKTSYKSGILFAGLLICMIAISLVMGYNFGKKAGVADCPKCDDQMIKRIVGNPYKKEKLPICGTVAPSQACLFYVLNDSSHDKLAEDFFEEVSRKVKRPVFYILAENGPYQKRPIKPGYFAEIIVPALR